MCNLCPTFESSFPDVTCHFTHLIEQSESHGFIWPQRNQSWEIYMLNYVPPWISISSMNPWTFTVFRLCLPSPSLVSPLSRFSPLPSPLSLSLHLLLCVRVCACVHMCMYLYLLSCEIKHRAVRRQVDNHKPRRPYDKLTLLVFHLHCFSPGQWEIKFCYRKHVFWQPETDQDKL